MGAFVADAAAMPFHWIYDTDLIASVLEEYNLTETPEFFPTNKYCLYYDYAVGEFTPFGEQMAVYAHSLATQQKVDPQNIADSYYSYYTSPENTTRPFVSYLDNATKGFLENVAAGARFPHTGAGDTETNAVAHVLPVVVMRAGREDFLEEAEAAIRVVQDNDDAVAFGMTFARMLEKVILGTPVDRAILEVAELLRTNGTGNPNDRWFGHALGKMNEWTPRPPMDVTLELGQACDFPFHVLTAPQFLLHSEASTTPMSFPDAIRETIKIGGENADRGSFIGSLIAAAAATVEDPTVAIPTEWVNKTTRYDEMLKVAEAIVDGGETRSLLRGKEDSQQSVPFTWVREHTAPTTDREIVRGPGLGNARLPMQLARRATQTTVRAMPYDPWQTFPPRTCVPTLTCLCLTMCCFRDQLFLYPHLHMN